MNAKNEEAPKAAATAFEAGKTDAPYLEKNTTNHDKRQAENKRGGNSPLLMKPSDDAILAAYSLIWQSLEYNDSKTLSDVSGVPDDLWPDADTLSAGKAIREAHNSSAKIDYGRLFDGMQENGSSVSLSQLFDMLNSEHIPYRFETDAPVRVLQDDHDRRFRLGILDRAKEIATSPDRAGDGEWEQIISELTAQARTPTLASRIVQFTDDWQTEDIPPREFAFSVACPLECVTVLCAAGGTGKSFLLLQVAMGLACGRELVPHWKPSARGKTLLVSFEDDELEIKRRMKRISNAYSITGYEATLIKDNLHVLTLQTPDFFKVNKEGEITPSTHLMQLASTLKDGGYRLCVVDPVASMLGGNIQENSNEAAQKVVNILTSLLPKGCALMLAAHTAKGDRDTASTPRGASAWTDSARQSWGMRPLNQDEREEVPQGIDPDAMVVLSGGKANYNRKPKPVYLVKQYAPDCAGVLKPLTVNLSDFEKKNLSDLLNTDKSNKKTKGKKSVSIQMNISDEEHFEDDGIPF